MSSRRQVLNEKGKAYNAERKKAKCKSVIKQMKKLMKDMELNTRYFDDVHYVQNDLEVLNRLKDELQTHYEAWISYLDEEHDVHCAHSWYEEKRHGLETFITGIHDWIFAAKENIEEQLNKSPSEHVSQQTRSSISAIERAKVAELMAQSSLIEKKQALRNQMEKLEFEEKLIIAKARQQALIESEEKRISTLHRNRYGTPQTFPTYLPSQKREINEEDNMTAGTFPNFYLKPTSLPGPLKRDPTTPRLPVNPTPQSVKVSPIPSSVASNIPAARLRDVKPKYELPTVRRSLAPMTPKPRFDWQYPPTSPRQDGMSIAQFLDRQNKLTEILTEQHQRSLLPPLTLSTFTNDPIDFTTFISNFESQIESKVHSSEVRLRYLEQYLEGEAKDLIKGCQHKDASIGYPEAKKLLKQKYGDPYKISNSYIKKATEWPAIRVGDDAALDSLSIFLIQCVSAMESMSYLSILDHPQNLQNLVRKLPLYLQDRWRRRVINIREFEDQVPGFKSFADFIKTEAKVATDPVFSKEALAKTDTKEQRDRTTKPTVNQRGRTYRVTSHVINTESPTSQASPKCILCDKAHDLDDCKQFKDRTLSDRKKFLAEKQMCYGCYKPGHRSRGCMQKRKCAVCQGRHPTGLHDYNFIATPRSHLPPGPETSRSDNNNTANTNRIISSRTAASEACGTAPEEIQSLPIVPVKLQWMDSQIISTYAMLDSCSTGTFITDEIYNQMKIEGTDTTILIQTMNGQALHDTKAVTGLQISDLAGENMIELPRTFTRESIPSSKNDIPQREMAVKWQHLKRIADQIPDCLQDSKVGVLIGTNCPKALEPRDFVTSQSNGPFAVLTFAGWTIVGPNSNGICMETMSTAPTLMNHITLVSSIKEIITPKTLNSMTELEFSERMDHNEPAYSQDDKHFLKIIEEGIKYKNGHYNMPLPFKESDVLMPCNKEQVISRATWIKNKLLKNQKMHGDYTKFMTEILDKDYARKVPSSQVPPEPGKVWYLPHHGVYHPHKPEKIRVVFDCSARLGEVSLNGKLLQGPDMTSSLVGVLTRFRKGPVAFQGDIEAMFHQVRVSEEHRDFLRFLWWPKGDLSRSLQEYQMNVHLFGAISSPSCANYAVRRTADDTESEFGKETVDVLRRNFYVDDCLRSEETEETAIERVHSTISACAKGGFRLTKITSNSRKVLETIPEEDRSKEVKGLDLSFDDLPVERALGVQWHIESDSFGFKITLKDKPLTRRGILSTISSVYDPLGFAAPILLPGKRILQELCKSNVDWDEPIPEQYIHHWEKWRNQLPTLERFGVARCLKPANFGAVIDLQIHSFSDASSTGYGQVSYIRQVNSNGDIHCAFLMGKARLAPIKAVTIPRLELTAAVVSSKIGCKLVEELDYCVQKPIYWTDSMTVLRYIHNEQNRYQVYVANRVQTIRDKTDPNQWRFVRGKDNPADVASRGLDIDNLSDQHSWIKGPDFLWKPENEWLEYPVNMNTDIQDPDIKKCAVNTTMIKDKKASILERFTYFSSWQRLKRAIAWLLRLSPKQVDPTTVSVNPEQKKTSKPRLITVKETEKAESVILKIVQVANFSSEIDTLKAINEERFCDVRSKLKRKKTELKRSSSLYKLDPVIDEDGLIRVGGRLSNSDQFTDDFKHPVILPKKDHVTTLIIRHAHEKMAHAGRGSTLGELRAKYWIISANSAVRSYITDCVKCRRYRGTAGQQKMADLPKSRITPEPPFTYCAVDLFGPFLIKEGRKELKRYGVIFTCLSSRAVHIETANSLETDTFLNALRRFIARRGPIREIHSDQGTNLMGAERELRQALEELDHNKLQNHLSSKFDADWTIKWKRNPPAASHMGGAWERQIRTIRSILKSLMHEYGHAINDESLRTLLTEVESIINSRPLTFPSSDSRDLDPLTPNHLLTAKSKVVMPPAGIFQREDVYLRKRWKRVQYLANLFWTRWKKEYVQNLQQRVKWNTVKRNFNVGDIVLIVTQESTPRNLWPMGRILQVKCDAKGLVRSATVKTSTSILERPIAKLILLLEQS